MKEIVISTVNEPFESHFWSIKSRAQTLFDMKLISALPTVGKRQSDKTGAWLIVITLPEVDYAVWFAFYLGTDCVRNNRDMFFH